MITSTYKKKLSLFWSLCLCIGCLSSTWAQTSITSSLDTSTCQLSVLLIDSSSGGSNTIASSNPPYLFTISNNAGNSMSYSNNNLGSVTIDVSTFGNGIYTINAIDGSQITTTGTININCGIAPSSLTLIDSITSDASTCSTCDGVGGIYISPANNTLYNFIWSDGVTISGTSGVRTNLCPGYYTVIVTDTIGNNLASTSFTMGCNGSPNITPPSCNNNLNISLDQNGNATILPVNLSNSATIPSNVTPYIIDGSGNTSNAITFTCNDLGYHNLQLVFTDSAGQYLTCNSTVQISDSLAICNGQNGVAFNDNSTNASTCATCDGSYTLVAISDTNNNFTANPPYTITWNDGVVTGPTRNNLCPQQVYNLIIADALGNTYHHNVTIACNTPGANNCIDTALIDSNLLCPTTFAPVCGCDNVTYINACIAQIQHGVSTWTTGPCNNSSGPITTSATTTPSSNCSVSGCDGTASVTITGGIPPYTIIWSDTTLFGTNPTNLCPGIYTATITDSDSANNNSVTIAITVGIDGCVWPGDADDNTIANNFDVLPIALAYQDQGIPRANANITWTGQIAQDWQQTPLTGLPNSKHMDCDGNGVIDSFDLNAIVQNYGQSYFRSAYPSLRGPHPFYIGQGSGNPGTNVQLPIILGDLNNPVINAYGVAFTINYDPTVVEPGSIQASFNNSWLGNDLIEVQKEFHNAGKLEIAVARIDKIPIATGLGQFGTVSIIIKDDVWIGRTQTGNDLNSPVTISDIRLIDHQNTEIGTTNQTGTITVHPLSTGITAANNQLDIQLFPNPARDLVHIHSKTATIQSIRLYTSTGQLIKDIEALNGLQHRLSTEDLSNGVYFISIQTNQGIHNTKVQVLR